MPQGRRRGWLTAATAGASAVSQRVACAAQASPAGIVARHTQPRATGSCCCIRFTSPTGGARAARTFAACAALAYWGRQGL